MIEQNNKKSRLKQERNGLTETISIN